jgi:hypothetical protein
MPKLCAGHSSIADRLYFCILIYIWGWWSNHRQSQNAHQSCKKYALLVPQKICIFGHPQKICTFDHPENMHFRSSRKYAFLTPPPPICTFGPPIIMHSCPPPPKVSSQLPVVQSRGFPVVQSASASEENW